MTNGRCVAGWRPKVLYGVAAAAGTLAVFAVASAAADTINNPDYRGSFIGVDSEGRIALKVKERRGKPSRVRIEVENVLLECEDGTTRRVDFDPVGGTLRRDGTFEVQKYHDLTPLGQSYFEVSGRILGRKRADGYFYWINDSYDPALTEEVDCTTPFPRPWIAKAVNPAAAAR
jgi:hypothetical protein